MRWLLVTSSSWFVKECVVSTRALPTCSYARTRFNIVTLTQTVETQTLLLGSRGPLLQVPALEGVILIDPVGSIAGWTGIWGCFSDVKDGWSAPLPGLAGSRKERCGTCGFLLGRGGIRLMSSYLLF